MRPPHWALRLYAGALEARAQRALADPEAAQRLLLGRILARFRHTELGRQLKLGSVEGPEDFAARVPVTDEATYRPLFERVLATNAPGLLGRAPLRFMARTSGTSEVVKYVPFTPELIRGFKRFETQIVMHAMTLLGDYSLLDGQLLITSGSPTVDVTAQGLTVGYGSGIMTLLAPRMATRLVRPTRPVLELTDWQAKIEATVAEARPLDVRVMTGIPLFVVPILEHLLAVTGAPNAQAVWPQLRAYCWSGSPIGPHESRLRELLGPGVAFFEIYSATESPVGYQRALDSPGLLLDVQNTYFEFQEAHAPLDAPRLRAHEVSVGVPYRLLVTTWGGLFAYRLGDVVAFSDTRPLTFAHLGREAEEITLGFEKLSLRQMESALRRTAAAHGATVRDFFVGPAAGARRAYHWFVEFEAPPADPTALLAELDALLCAEHAVYGSMRGGEAVLGAPELTVLPAGAIARHVLATRQFGQGKFVRLHSRREPIEAILAGLGG